ncbi:MAG: 5-aminolevulinate synthase, partial [Alphaproteobacteria bacterium]|nr:5-aminolevulinate synthase [Alphaproteobacteria bacterium]
MAYAYTARFEEAIGQLKRDGRYRVFADLLRKRGSFPCADFHTETSKRPVTVWCSNDYLGMGQHPK